MLNLIGFQPKYEDYIEEYVENIMIKKNIGKKSEFFGGLVLLASSLQVNRINGEIIKKKTRI